MLFLHQVKQNELEPFTLYMARSVNQIHNRMKGKDFNYCKRKTDKYYSVYYRA